MNTELKSLELARLMGWKINKSWILRTPYLASHELNPYEQDVYGLAQFAAILLKFPWVMYQFVQQNDSSGIGIKEPTQANILDEILAMNGLDV